jgi:hypothetical protein
MPAGASIGLRRCPNRRLMPGLDALLAPEPAASPVAPQKRGKGVSSRRQSPMRIDQIAPGDDMDDVDREEEDAQEDAVALGAGAGGDAFLSGRYKPRRPPARSATVRPRPRHVG